MKSSLKTLWLFGPSRGRIRGIELGDLIRVLWREHGRRHVKSWPNTVAGRREAKAWAEGFAETRHRPAAEPVAGTKALWERFAEAEFPHLRIRTRQLYRERWNKWEVFIGHDFPADAVTLENCDQFRAALTKSGMAPNQIAEHLKMVKLVYAWALRRELIEHNRVGLYRFRLAKEERKHEPAEYRTEDYEHLIAELPAQRYETWRAHVALALVGNQGVRIRAALHLRWDDVDLVTGRLIWRARFDKLGREWSQPMLRNTYAALLTAHYWALRADPTNPWVLFSDRPQSGTQKHGREEPGVYRVQAFWQALRNAEARASIPHLPFRAAHGFRRMVAGNVLQEFGDPKLAMDFIGDRDLALIKRYLKQRDDRLQETVDRLDAKGLGEADCIPMAATTSRLPAVGAASLTGAFASRREGRGSLKNAQEQHPKGATEVPPAAKRKGVRSAKPSSSRTSQSHRSDLNRRPPVSIAPKSHHSSRRQARKYVGKSAAQPRKPAKPHPKGATPQPPRSSKRAAIQAEDRPLAGQPSEGQS